MPLTQDVVNNVIEQLKSITPTNTEKKHAKAYLLGKLKEFVTSADKQSLEDELYIFCLDRRPHIFHTDRLNEVVQQLKKDLSPSKAIIREQSNKAIAHIRTQLFSFLDDNTNRNNNRLELPDLKLNWYEKNTRLDLIKQIHENDLQSAYNQNELLISAATYARDEIVKWLLNESGTLFSTDVLREAVGKAAGQAELAYWSHEKSECTTYDHTVSLLLEKLGKGNYDAIELSGHAAQIVDPLRSAYLFGWPKVLRVLINDGLVQTAERTYAQYSRISEITFSYYPICPGDSIKFQLISLLLEAGVSIDNEPTLLGRVIGQKDPQVLALLIRNNINLNRYSGDKNLYDIAVENKWDDVKKALVEMKYPAAILAVKEDRIATLEAQLAALTQVAQQQLASVSGNAVVRLSKSVGTQTDSELVHTNKAHANT
ncbi:MAG: hypothetical protein ACHQAX_08455 [Gammaproteobacteria bacterium]